MGDSGEAECKQTGDVYSSDKIVKNVEILAQSSADFALTIFRAFMYWAHRAVIFAIAHFSCYCTFWLCTTAKIGVYPKETKNWIWELSMQYTPTEITECNKRYVVHKMLVRLLSLIAKRLNQTHRRKNWLILLYQKFDVRKFLWGRLGRSPDNFLALGGSPPMESAPMVLVTLVLYSQEFWAS